MKLRYLIFSIIALLLFQTPCSAVYGAKVPILLYHNLAEEFLPEHESLHITPDNFRAHMQALKDAGFHTISFQEYYDYRINDAVLPENPIIITFDDGYISNYRDAFPILRELSMKATMFAVTRSSFYPTSFDIPHYDWKMAKEMEKSGLVQVESHSFTHPRHTDLPLWRVEQEARISYYHIKTFVGKEPLVYAYPNGAFSPETQQLVQKAGYRMQVKVGNNGVNTDDTPLDQLVRINIGGFTTADQLIALVNRFLGV